MKSTILHVTWLIALVASLTPFPPDLRFVSTATAQVVQTTRVDGVTPTAAQGRDVNPTWSGGQRVSASDATPLDYFGSVVALSGDVAVIGANAATIGSNAFQGAAYVFVHVGDSWSQVAKLTADDGAAGDLFGSAVAISGNTVLVGASNATIAGTTLQGAAYVFTGSGTDWTQVTKLTASDGAENAYFGLSVALGDGTAMVGATDGGTSGNYQGKVYVFSNAGGAWTEEQMLTPDDGAPFDRFGSSIALDGAEVLIGAAGAEVGGDTFRGAAYIFEAANGSWGQSAKLTALDGLENDGFGWSVALHGGTAAVGAPGATIEGQGFQGAAYLFNNTGTGWSGTAKLTASDGTAGDSLGWSVALGPDSVLVGAFAATISGNLGQGAVYAYAPSGDSWNQMEKLTAHDGIANDEFGNAIALDGNTALIGAPHATDDGTGSSGSSYFYEQPPVDMIFGSGFDVLVPRGS